MDPLLLLEQAEAQGKIPRAVGKKVRSRMKYLIGAVRRVELASGLRYPPYYVEPVLPVAKSASEFGQMGVLYARVIPTTATGKLSILVQFTAALVCFASKGTMEGVAAHEFTHYVDLVRRLSKTEVMSDEMSNTLFESAYADTGRTVPAALVFSEKAIVSLVKRKFKDGLVDPVLTKKTGDGWIAKNLPIRYVSPEDNKVKLGVGAVLETSFDPHLLRTVALIDEKMSR